MKKAKICSKSIANMPVGFHGKFCTVVNDERYTWFIQNLVKASNKLPIVEIALNELDIYLDVNAWFHGEKQPTVRAIIEHYRRVDQADLTFPIIINPQFGVIDGLHRIAKAHVSGRSSIKAVILTKLPEPDYIGDF